MHKKFHGIYFRWSGAFVIAMALVPGVSLAQDGKGDEVVVVDGSVKERGLLPPIESDVVETTEIQVGRESELPSIGPIGGKIRDESHFLDSFSSEFELDEVAALSNEIVIASYVPGYSTEKSKEKLFDVATMTGNMKEPTSILSSIRLPANGTMSGQMAAEGPRATGGSQGLWFGTCYTWTAPSFYHNTLYFEQVNLERYGAGARPALQPVVSSAHFFTNVVALPVKVVRKTPWAEVYTLGRYRPGSCAPVQTCFGKDR